MVVGATPDDVLPGADSHIVRCQEPVLGSVHLSGKVGAGDCEASGAITLLCAVVAAGATGTSSDRHPIRVPSGAEPPDQLVGTWRDRIDGEFPVLGGMPVPCDEREEGGEVVDANDDDAVQTHRAAATVGGTV